MRPRKRKLCRLLDVLVAVDVIGALLFGLFGVFASGSAVGRRLVEMADQESPVLTVPAAMSGILVLLWMFVGDGVHSRLWNWLPPFVMFPRNSITRWIVGLALGICTLIAVCI